MCTRSRAVSRSRWSNRLCSNTQAKTCWFTTIKIRLSHCVRSVFFLLTWAIYDWLTSAADAFHSHFELGTVLSFTKGYEIWVFDYGTFSLAGDGGYENWAIGGCFSGPPTAVIFTECSWKHTKHICSYALLSIYPFFSVLTLQAFRYKHITAIYVIPGNKYNTFWCEWRSTATNRQIGASGKPRRASHSKLIESSRAQTLIVDYGDAEICLIDKIMNISWRACEIIWY